MKKGKWYLTYQDYSGIESIATSLQTEEIALDATEEDQAIEEAWIKWREMAVESEWPLDPTPCVIYKIPLKAD